MVDSSKWIREREIIGQTSHCEEIQTDKSTQGLKNSHFNTMS